MKYFLEKDDIIKMKVSYIQKFNDGKSLGRVRYCDKLSVLHYDKHGNQHRETVLLKDCYLKQAQEFTIDELSVFVSVPKFNSEMSVIVLCNSSGECLYTLLDKDDELIAQNLDNEQVQQAIKKYAPAEEYVDEN